MDLQDILMKNNQDNIKRTSSIFYIYTSRYFIVSVWLLAALVASPFLFYRKIVEIRVSLENSFQLINSKAIGKVLSTTYDILKNMKTGKILVNIFRLL